MPGALCRSLVMRGLAVAVFLVSALVAVCPQAVAGSLELDNFILDNQAGSITVRFGLHFDNLDDLEAELAAGTTVGLKCEAEVRRKKSLWADARVAGTTWVSPLRKDVLANDYVVVLPGGERELRNKDLAVLLDQAWRGVALDLGPWESLLPGHDYRLEMNISMDRLDVPVWLRYVVFFWSFDLCEPVSYQLDFNY